jgi:histidinol phosphatase-like PHP family hydrolase
MIYKEDIIADMHTHTISSLHAYSTIEENIMYAQRAGMKYIAVRTKQRKFAHNKLLDGYCGTEWQ